MQMYYATEKQKFQQFKRLLWRQVEGKYTWLHNTAIQIMKGISK